MLNSILFQHSESAYAQVFQAASECDSFMTRDKLTRTKVHFVLGQSELFLRLSLSANENAEKLPTAKIYLAVWLGSYAS